jgi:peptidoglycan hydrolase-like protein with peptidoglycan-binding domain
VRLLERKAESLEKRVFATYGTPTGDDLHRFILAAYFAGQGSVEKAVKRTYPEGRPAALRFDDLKGQLTVYANAIVARARQGQPATDEDDDTPAAAAPDAASLLALFEPVVKVFTSAHSFLTSLGDEDGLRSTTLGSVERLVRLVAEDEAGAAIARDDPDEEAVAALQRALALAGYDLGTFGPARDGIDGDFGGTTEKVVKRFQKEKLAGIVAAHPERFEGTSARRGRPRQGGSGDPPGLGPPGGPLEDGPDDDVPLPAPAALAAPVATPSTPAAPLGAEVTFDAASQRTSMQFGLRMYQAMLRWQWKRQADGRYEGVGFSTTVATDYGTYLRRATDQSGPTSPGWSPRMRSPRWAGASCPSTSSG